MLQICTQASSTENIDADDEGEGSKTPVKLKSDVSAIPRALDSAEHTTSGEGMKTAFLAYLGVLS